MRRRAPYDRVWFFAHLMRSRLVGDFARRATGAEAMIYWSMIGLMTRRLARSRSQ